MSMLTDELEYIFGWLEAINPDPEEYTFDCYRAGLTRKEIDEYARRLPFKLPQDIYELYQFRNGINTSDINWSSVVFLFPEQMNQSPNLDFYSLQESISNYFDLCDLSRELADACPDSDEYWHQSWFPIASFENKRILYIIGDADPSPIYLWDNILGIRRVYRDLTSMISVIAECCELNIYKLVSREYEGEVCYYLYIDKEKLDIERNIYKKYNP